MVTFLTDIKTRGVLGIVTSISGTNVGETRVSFLEVYE